MQGAEEPCVPWGGSSEVCGDEAVRWGVGKVSPSFRASEEAVQVLTRCVCVGKMGKGWVSGSHLSWFGEQPWGWSGGGMVSRMTQAPPEVLHVWLWGWGAEGRCAKKWVCVLGDMGPKSHSLTHTAVQLTSWTPGSLLSQRVKSRTAPD